MIKNNLQQIRSQIEQASEKCDRNPQNIKLIAVSKTKPCSLIAQAIEAGQFSFGENYVQEGIEKIQYFNTNDPSTTLEWHFIGPLQSNKTKLVAAHFDWVQTIDRLKIAQRLNDQRPSSLARLNVLIQVNISEQESKSGITPDEILPLATAILALPNLQLRGLMAIPEPKLNSEQQLLVLRKMFALYQSLQALDPNIDTLSMGMSDDLALAIIAGSNMVRVGSAIFGARGYN